jgi:hypothetical protein
MVVAALTLAAGAASPLRAQERASASVPALPRVKGATPRNVVFILADDHRYDAIGFMGNTIVQTPSIDRIAERGVHLRNAFVTTALCSPSRATILTGLYAHQHPVVDNNTPVPAGTTTGSATSRRRRPSSRCGRSATSSSATTACGTWTSSSTSRPIRRR